MLFTADQSGFKDHQEARHSVVTNIYPMIEAGYLFWDNSILLSDWIESQANLGVFGDHYSLQIAANLLGRDILIIPTVLISSANNPDGYILVEPSNCIGNNPIFLLYLEENVYGCGHYQSIMPDNLQSRVIQHYNFKKIARTRTLSSLGEPAFSSSKIVESGTEPETTVFGTSQESQSQSSRSKARVGCHVCGQLIKHGTKRKRCKCGQYCHNKCLGLCTK